MPSKLSGITASSSTSTPYRSSASAINFNTPSDQHHIHHQRDDPLLTILLPHYVAVVQPICRQRRDTLLAGDKAEGGWQLSLWAARDSWGLSDVCHTYLHKYLAMLPERHGLPVHEWQPERYARHQSTTTLDAPRIRLMRTPLDAATLADTMALIRGCLRAIARTGS